MKEMTLNEIIQLTKEDMPAVNDTILQQLNSDVTLINQLGHYIINGGGKRIRPMITILSAKALNYQGTSHITAAAFIEFIHTATLLHDDVVDESDMRRGKATANATFGNAASVLVGDFIYTRSFQMMTSLGSLRILELMSQATNIIAEGEVQQLLNCNNPDITEKDYLQVIYNKTARLFETSAQISAILAEASFEYEQALKNYGCFIGTAFQLIDDLLDYSTDNVELGKNIGDDLNEGKLTLPLLHAIENSNHQDANLIRQTILQGNGRHLLDNVLSIMHKCHSLEYTQMRAEQQAQKAIEALLPLPESDFKQALKSLAKLSTKRKS